MIKHTKHNKITYFLIFLVLVYSTYINVKMPTITEGFTGNVREMIRPRLRKVRNMITNRNKHLKDRIKLFFKKLNK